MVCPYRLKPSVQQQQKSFKFLHLGRGRSTTGSPTEQMMLCLSPTLWAIVFLLTLAEFDAVCPLSAYRRHLEMCQGVRSDVQCCPCKNDWPFHAVSVFDIVCTAKKKKKEEEAIFIWIYDCWISPIKSTVPIAIVPSSMTRLEHWRLRPQCRPFTDHEPLRWRPIMHALFREIDLKSGPQTRNSFIRLFDEDFGVWDACLSMRDSAVAEQTIVVGSVYPTMASGSNPGIGVEPWPDANAPSIQGKIE